MYNQKGLINRLLSSNQVIFQKLHQTHTIQNYKDLIFLSEFKIYIKIRAFPVIFLRLHAYFVTTGKVNLIIALGPSITMHINEFNIT